jgi:tetratricopeptide (TPR) repeat protein
MNLPDWRTFAFEPGILAEPISDGNRLVLWIPDDRDTTFQYWERVGNVIRAEIVSEQGLWATAATSVRARQRLGGGLGRLLRGLLRSDKSRGFSLPDGTTSEQCGERRADVLLVWSSGGERPIDLSLVQSAWPQAKRCRRLSSELYLIDGIETGTTAAAQTARAPEPEPEQVSDKPREQAEQRLAAARKAGDRALEATALTDVGVTKLSEGDHAGAVASLESALAMAKELGDRERESDIIGNLGLAVLGVGQSARARQMFEHGLAFARAKRDHLGEKTAMERLGLAHWHLREFATALSCFDQALGLAQMVGDRMQAANLLWFQGIQYAELGQRDLAIAKAEESIALFRAMGRPQAAWYGSHLQKYRMGLFEDAPADAPAGVSVSPQSYLGGAMVASVMASSQAVSAQGQKASPPNSGPGLLRMAMSATKAMTTFVGSGMKTTPADIQQKRTQTCATCEHHTGMRCKVCGCFTHVKIKMMHEDCPIGKWPR